MRPLEIAFWVASVPLLLWCLSHQGLPVWVRVAPAVALALAGAHVAVEGARWHLAPAYLVTLCLFFACAWPRVPRLEPGPWGALAGFGLLAVAAALGTFFPVFQLPEPTGSHPIGTVALHLVDPTRSDPLTDRPDRCRELMVQIWYPAERAGPGGPYRRAADTTLRSSHLTLVRTHAAAGAPVAGAPGRFPVIVFAPSWSGGRADNTVQVEELASHGFVVIGIDHPHSSDLVVFPDGRKARTALTGFLDYSTDETLVATRHAVEEQLRLRVADVRFVLDELGRRDAADPDDLFTGRLDLSRVGVFGHSFGGATAGEVCRADPRVAAGINMDGFMFGESLSSGSEKPFLFFIDGGTVPTAADIAKATNDTVRRRLSFLSNNVAAIRRGLARVGGYYVRIPESRHMDYCDAPLYFPTLGIGLINKPEIGSIRYDRLAGIVNAYILSFFRRHLKGEEDGLLDRAPSPFPEVEIERLVNGES